uniref:PilN domain-containing protein n=1 Tax=Synechococcus sp. UW106 TaxID=368495 RepID=UPI000E0F4E90|nr:PilN domain-containing protein [Synechococcus sp. UW106]
MAPVDRSGGLSAGAWLDLDLLRQRRERFGLEHPKVIPVRELLWRGGLIGAVAPLFLLLVVLFFVVQDRQLAQRQRRLEPIAAEHDRVDQVLIAAMQMLEQSRSTNAAIAEAMADVRSSSAVLAEVRRLVPESIVFDRLTVQGNVLEISGSAEQPNGLRLVNALLLRLSASGFFAPELVELANAHVAGQAEEAALEFSLRAGFAADAAVAMRTSLSRLGSEGMARRMAVLMQEGLVQ